jgi:penicillin-binding protein 1A
MPKTLSLALGSLSLSPIELTTAYAVIANGGYKIEPYLIDHITNRHGEVLLKANPPTVCHPGDTQKNCAPTVIPADLAFLIHSALQSVIDHGTAVSAKSLGRQDLAGKTGTTNEQVDAWFAGFTPSLVTTTWFGFDTPKPLHEYAANLALPLWIDFMRIALKGIPEQPITPPENIQKISINPMTGSKAPAGGQNIEEYFSENALPTTDDDPAPAAPESRSNPTPESTEENLF